MGHCWSQNNNNQNELDKHNDKQRSLLLLLGYNTANCLTWRWGFEWGQQRRPIVKCISWRAVHSVPRYSGRYVICGSGAVVHSNFWRFWPKTPGRFPVFSGVVHSMSSCARKPVFGRARTTKHCPNLRSLSFCCRHVWSRSGASVSKLQIRKILKSDHERIPKMCPKFNTFDTRN